VRFWFATAVVLFTCACASAQTPAEGQSKPAATFDSARAFEHLKRIVEIGPRPAGSGGIQTTRDYIKNEMKALGLAISEQGFEASTPAGRLRMVNLRVTIPGASNTGRLIIAGHYDTKRFDDITFVGANDAGSSTAFLIELARVLKDRKNPLTIELLFLDGEEAIGEWATGNTYGSRHYVFQASQNAASLRQIKAMILVDMIADKELTFKRDENSTPWLTDVIWSVARKLNRPEFSAETTYVEDDHLPFLRAGIPAVDIIDLEYPDVSNRYWHTAEDTLDKVSPHGLQVVGDVLLEALPAIELRVR
jgi:Zn-dependent M28 family amino/carboxypeptidase